MKPWTTTGNSRPCLETPKPWTFLGDPRPPWEAIHLHGYAVPLWKTMDHPAGFPRPGKPWTTLGKPGGTCDMQGHPFPSCPSLRTQALLVTGAAITARPPYNCHTAPQPPLSPRPTVSLVHIHLLNKTSPTTDNVFMVLDLRVRVNRRMHLEG